jgi:hypothetical protein
LAAYDGALKPVVQLAVHRPLGWALRASGKRDRREETSADLF